jgi:hypothetical protein
MSRGKQEALSGAPEALYTAIVAKPRGAGKLAPTAGTGMPRNACTQGAHDGAARAMNEGPCAGPSTPWTPVSAACE